MLVGSWRALGDSGLQASPLPENFCKDLLFSHTVFVAAVVHGMSMKGFRCFLNATQILLKKVWYSHGLEFKSISIDKTPGNHQFGFNTKQMVAETFRGSEGKQYHFATGSSRNKTVCLCLKKC